MLRFILKGRLTESRRRLLTAAASATGGAGRREEGRGEGEGEEKGGGAKLPAAGEPGQGDARPAQSPDHA